MTALGGRPAADDRGAQSVRQRPAWRARVLMLALVSTGAAVGGASSPAEARDGVLPLSAYPRERIAIETRKSFRRLMFVAWRADTPRAREQGLMYVRDEQMRADEAMIFVYEPPEFVSMWMKNTILSLDMLFVNPRGCVVSIHERARPGSLDTIGSGQPVSLVVELKAGAVAAHGIAVGDRVVRVDASWPTDTATPCR
jgi:uncharacterized membrane protein (UPF0127 family)